MGACSRLGDSAKKAEKTGGETFAKATVGHKPHEAVEVARINKIGTYSRELIFNEKLEEIVIPTTAFIPEKLICPDTISAELHDKGKDFTSPLSSQMVEEYPGPSEVLDFDNDITERRVGAQSEPIPASKKWVQASKYRKH
ncbi:hypothetical protein PanWU01x14_259260 [Parasponia andersonii]|uniref:Uncharacterized protein n=1 Tax=Parasponia andersonii TaxID=3476 RepID=A0A2P5B9F1_PARAD|nr:hypothetical protein PanWU01x14_259260 [Parasponia andersonii]